MTTQAEKGAAFRDLHHGEPFVIPNPWDAGSARMLEAMGFRALATTSSGAAFTLGKHDGSVTVDEMAAHVALIVGATTVPVSVDLENGYGPSPVDVTAAVVRAAEAGAVGASIEDWDRSGFLYPIEQATVRIEAAAEAARGLSVPFVLTARAENHIRQHQDLGDTIERLLAYAAAGADVLFAPGLREIGDIRRVCEGVDKPVNVLAWPGTSMTEVAAAGAQRVSVGGGLTWAAVSAMMDVAMAIRDQGDFSGLGRAPSLPD